MSSICLGGRVFQTGTRLAVWIAVFLALVALLPNAAFAQTPDFRALAKQTSEWKDQLDKIDNEIKTIPLTESYLSKVIADLEKINHEASAFITDNTPYADDAKQLLDKLGEAPKEGEPPEAEEVAKQRAELSERYGIIDSAIRAANSLVARTAQLRELVYTKRRDLFASEVLRKNKSPFSLTLWQESVPAIARAGNLVSIVLGGWATRHSPALFWQMLIAAAALGFGLYFLMRRWIVIYRSHPEGTPPPFFRQAASAGVVAAMRAVPPILAAALFYLGISYFDMLTSPFDEIAPVTFAAFGAFAVIGALSTTLLAPDYPIWRIIPVSTPAARRLNRLLLAIAAVYGIDLFLNLVNKTLLLPLSLTIVQSAIASVVFAGLLTGVLRTSFDTHKLGEKSQQPVTIRLLKLPLWAVVFVVLLTTALGYISLARFLTQQTVVTGSILIVVYLVHLTINELTDSFGNAESRGGHMLLSMFGMQEQRREQVGAVTMLAMNLMLILITLPFLALQWGFGWNDVYLWSNKFLFGFQFGGLTISFSAILIAVLLFFAGTILTRMFQGWLDQRILSKSASNTGAANSIKTAVGYLGVVISALIAISYTGISFSNIAIVAGALSVGIGFGLQSIVNNFVSGLILLAERPIKVGDWIVIGDDQGLVRRISVRSTEIETFDRAQIIIPNSELISGTVKNWTLRGPLGRVTINVGVSYDSDPRRVHDMLLDIAKQHEKVLDYPAPFVVFDDFGDSSLNFALYAYLPDVTQSLGVRTSLRIAIYERFKQENIEIPFPQRDLHLRDIDRLEKAMRAQSEPPKNRRNPRQQRANRNDRA